MPRLSSSAATRLAAGEVLALVLGEKRTMADALARTERLDDLEPRDRAFARAIVSATLRRLGSIDAVLANFLQTPLPETAYLGQALLRAGAAQILVLETPAHAAVSETVDAANAERAARGFARLMNAVLRKVASDGPALLAALPPGADLPPWLYTRWRAAYGDEAERIAAALRTEPPLDLTVKDNAEARAAKLGGVVSPTGGVRLTDAHGVAALEGYAEGAWWVQDSAAALPAKLLGDIAGKRVLDLCAAPGGKTLQLANAGAIVTALDKSAQRLERVRENLARTNLAAEIVAADALTWSPGEPFDAVLLDAPCTATGTMRRHPDIAWLRRPSDIQALAAQQRALLARAQHFVKPGGVLVYAVCSLEPEEGPAIVSEALESGAWTLSPIAPEEIGGHAQLLTARGELRTLPSHFAAEGGLDGFYAARLIRTP
ncbi:MAG: RsmB/NOP family class I SAM-dependent RNA methyltransferase [Hyphomonadaceae bacterium]